MSYRCQVCQKKVAPKQPQLRYVKYGKNGAIVKEIPVCQDCLTKLTGKQPIDFETLLARCRRVEPEPTVPTGLQARPMRWGNNEEGQA